MAFLTDRKRAQGLGSGRQGTHHHWQMMASSMALVVIVPLFVITFGLGIGGTYEETIAYFSRPFPAIVMGLSLIIGIIHLMHEALVAIEDYVHGVPQKIALITVTWLSYTMIGVGLFALARLAL